MPLCDEIGIIPAERAGPMWLGCAQVSPLGMADFIALECFWEILRSFLKFWRGKR